MVRPGEDTVMVDLMVRPSWALLTAVRRFVESAFESYTPDGDLLCRLSLSAYELMENAVKYAQGPFASLRLHVDPARGMAGMVLANDATEEHVAELRRHFSELQAVDDPFGYYCELMRRAAGRPGSRLGLGRIVAEGEMVLSLEVEGKRVRIGAETPLTESVFR
jgi:hypothetical protein